MSALFIYTQLKVYMETKYPEGLPENLRSEYDKYKSDPKRYEKLYPVAHKLLLKYIGAGNGQKDQGQSRK